MLRSRFSVAVNRALVRRSLFHRPRICKVLSVAPQTTAHVYNSSTATPDVNRVFDNNDSGKVGTLHQALSECKWELAPKFECMGPPASAVERALKFAPDDEWDVIVDLIALFQSGSIPEELKDAQDDLESNTSIANEMFFDWQWKIMGTARLLESPLGSWTYDQWFSAENLLLNGWPDQHCIRAVILQFALLRRVCLETEIWKQQQMQLQSESEPMSTPSNTITSPYNNSEDSMASLLNGDTALDSVRTKKVFSRKFGKKMLSRLVFNWRRVYLCSPDILRQYNLSPQELFDDVINIYCEKYDILLNEKIFRYILVAETTHRDKCTPEFAEQVLSHTLDLYDSDMEDCFPTTTLWNYVLLSWTHANRRQATTDGVMRIVQLMDELKVQRNRQTYMVLLRECVQRATEQSARDSEDFLRQMYKEFLMDNIGVQPDMSVFIYVVDAWAKSKSPLAGPRAEQIYEQMKALRAKNHLLETGKGRDGLDLEYRLFTCVLKCYFEVGTIAAAEKAEQFWRRTRISPEPSTFSALINVYAKCNDTNSAERIWNEMTSTDASDGLSVKDLEFAASALLNAYSFSNIPNKFEKAEALLNRIKDTANITLDTACYNAYIKVLMTEKNNETKLKAHEVLRQMSENNAPASTKPDVISYSTVMNGWAQMGEFERTSEVLRMMYDDYVNGNVNAKPDVMAYNTLLTSYLRSKDSASWTRAAALVDHMKKISIDGVLDVEPDVFSMSTALACLSHSKDDLIEAAMKAEEILNEMRTSYMNGNFRMQPNSYCYNNVMDVWARQGKPEKAEAIFLQMCKDLDDGNSAARPATATYNILLKAWAYSCSPHAVERAEQIIEQITASKLKPDLRSYTTLISCYGRSLQRGAPQKAEKVLRHMDELYDKGILKEGPSERTFWALRKGWERSNEPDKLTAMASLDEEIQKRFPSRMRK